VITVTSYSLSKIEFLLAEKHSIEYHVLTVVIGLNRKSGEKHEKRKEEKKQQKLERWNFLDSE
jgi:hypothetical protein